MTIPRRLPDDVRALIQNRIDRGGRIGGAVTTEAIATAERDVGRFPPDYAAFVAEFGWLEAGSFEVFGLGPAVPPHLDVVNQTRRERNDLEPGLADGYVAIAPDGAGNIYCLGAGDGAVYFRDHEFGGSAEDLEPYSENFETWLTERLKWWE